MTQDESNLESAKSHTNRGLGRDFRIVCTGSKTARASAKLIYLQDGLRE